MQVLLILATILPVLLKLNRTNHPSAIEPYQGAATGVGGINRDIFTMGQDLLHNLTLCALAT